MKIYENIEQKTPEWFAVRQGKLTGTLLKKVIGTPKVRENAFYELVAERLSIVENDEESAMARGNRLESEARQAFIELTGKKVEEVGFLESDENKFIGCSPDGLIKNKKGVYDEAVEIKCMSSANHVKCFVEDKVPEEYYAQVVQYFIVNKDLKKLYFVSYDPRIAVRPMHIIHVDRKDVEQDAQVFEQKAFEFLASVNDLVKTLI